MKFEVRGPAIPSRLRGKEKKKSVIIVDNCIGTHGKLYMCFDGAIVPNQIPCQ